MQRQLLSTSLQREALESHWKTAETCEDEVGSEPELVMGLSWTVWKEEASEVQAAGLVLLSSTQNHMSSLTRGFLPCPDTYLPMEDFNHAGSYPLPGSTASTTALSSLLS